jgi:hypothetical protein
MPFRSEKQRRFLWATHPEIAKRWAHEGGGGKKRKPATAKRKKSSGRKRRKR